MRISPEFRTSSVVLAASTVVTTVLAAAFLLPLLDSEPESRQTGTPEEDPPVPLSYQEFYQSVSNSQDDADEPEDRGHRKAPIAWDDLLSESDDPDPASLSRDSKDDLPPIDVRNVIEKTADESPSEEVAEVESEATRGFARVYPPETTQSIGLPSGNDAPHYTNPANMSSGSVYAPITVNVDADSVAREIASQLERFEQRMELVLSSAQRPQNTPQTARTVRKDRRKRVQTPPNAEIADLRDDVRELTESVQQLRAETESRLQQLAIRTPVRTDAGPGMTRVAEAPRNTTRDYEPPTLESANDFPTPEVQEIESVDDSIRKPAFEEREVPLPRQTPVPSPQTSPRTIVPDQVPELPSFEDADLPEELSTPALNDEADRTLPPGLDAQETIERPSGDRRAPLDSDNIFPPPSDDELSELDLTTRPLKSTNTKPATAANAAPVAFQHVHRFPAGEIIESPAAAHQKRSSFAPGTTNVCPVCGKVHPPEISHHPVKQVSHSIRSQPGGHAEMNIPSGPYRSPRVLEGARGRNRHIHRKIRQNHPETDVRPSMLHRLGATLQNWSNPIVD